MTQDQINQNIARNSTISSLRDIAWTCAPNQWREGERMQFLAPLDDPRPMNYTDAPSPSLWPRGEMVLRTVMDGGQRMWRREFCGVWFPANRR